MKVEIVFLQPKRCEWLNCQKDATRALIVEQEPHGEFCMPHAERTLRELAKEEIVSLKNQLRKKA